MPPSPTARVKLEKQATGENRDDWGNRLNTVSDLIDERVDGVATNSGGDFTLSITSYASSAGRKAVQKITGTATTVTLPAQELNRWFHNTTANEVTLTLGSGTTAKLKPGALDFIYTDGLTGVWSGDPTLRTLDKFAAPVAPVGFGGQRGTNAAAGVAPTDLINKAQLDAKVFDGDLIPSGSAVGQTLRWNGTDYEPGALDLSDADAVTGILPLANWGGTKAGARAQVFESYAGNGNKLVTVAADASDIVFSSFISRNAKTANYTVVAADARNLIDCTNTITIALTAAATLGANFTFSVRNSGTGIVTIDPDGSELIDGRATIRVYPGEAFDVVCTGTAFVTKGRAKGLILITQSVIPGSVASVDFELGFDDPEFDALHFKCSGLTAAGSSGFLARFRKSGAYQTTGYTGNALATTGIALTSTNSAGPIGACFDIIGHASALANVAAACGISISTQAVWGVQSTAAAVTGCRFYATPNNLTAGTITQYGARI